MLTEKYILVLCLCGLARMLESLKRLASNRIFLVELFNFFEQLRPILGLLPSRSEFIRSKRNLRFEALANDAFRGIGERSEVVCRSLAQRTIEAHFDKECLGGMDIAKINLATLVKNSNLVKDLGSVSMRGQSTLRSWALTS